MFDRTEADAASAKKVPLSSITAVVRREPRAWKRRLTSVAVCIFAEARSEIELALALSADESLPLKSLLY